MWTFRFRSCRSFVFQMLKMSQGNGTQQITLVFLLSYSSKPLVLLGLSRTMEAFIYSWLWLTVPWIEIFVEIVSSLNFYLIFSCITFLFVFMMFSFISRGEYHMFCFKESSFEFVDLLYSCYSCCLFFLFQFYNFCYHFCFLFIHDLFRYILLFIF